MKYDVYLYDDCNVLKNKLGIKDGVELDKAESALASAGMMNLFECGFKDFSPKGICDIHRIIFGDVYEWAGKYRSINVQKREPLLAGKSVWYSNWDCIDKDLNNAWDKINRINWDNLSHDEFAKSVAHMFPAIWQVHPFREGNTRTVVMLIALFAEHYGYFFDYELMSASAGYVRNAFVLCCFGEHSEFEHLERILLDAICDEPIEDTIDLETREEKLSKYEKYYTQDYTPTPHEYTD
ncbi:MAG: Fic/DOC family protein [Ruminococcus sp.]